MSDPDNTPNPDGTTPNGPGTAGPNAHEVPLSEGSDPVVVAGGPADAFILRADGLRTPLGTFFPGEAVFPLAAGLIVLAVARIGATLTPTPRADLGANQTFSGFAATVDTTISASSPADEAPSASAEEPADDQAGGAADTPANTAADASPSAAPEESAKDPAGGTADGMANSTTEEVAELTALVTAYLQRKATARVDEAHRSQNAEATADSQQMRRIAFSAMELREPVASPTNVPLLTTLEILGAVQGFAVVAPTIAELRSTNDPMRTICHKSGVRYRAVHLGSDWQESSSAYLGFLTSNGESTPVALLPHRGGYRYQRPQDQASRPLTPEVLSQIDSAGVEFFPPLPRDRSVTRGDAIRLSMRGNRSLWIIAAGAALAAALLGLLTPILTNAVISRAVPDGQVSQVMQAGVALVIAATVGFVILILQNYAVAAISQRSTRTLQAAFWDRMLSLPANFYREFSSGDLTVRVLAVDELQQLLSIQVVSALMAAAFGGVYVVLLFVYNIGLAIAATAFLLLTTLLLWWSLRILTGQSSRYIAAERKGAGWMVQLLTAIPKVRLAGAEDRMLNPYLEFVRQQAVAGAQQTRILGRINAWFLFAASAAPALFLLTVDAQWGTSAPVTVGQYIAFTSAYGLAFAAVSGLTTLLIPVSNAGPIFDLLQPMMTATPENAGNLQDPGRLTGKIELRGIRFRYSPDAPIVLDDLNLTVNPGEMVALVGPSGAGKSTITRILLGFEQPEEGEILFDGRVFADLDPTLVRAQMGVVVQEGTILRSSILRNITGSPHGDEDAAWAAAESAAFADDIRAMPMGMETIVNPQNISGGQSQRILLARALLPEPPILILDEATSALDNAAQAKVTAAMTALQSTRIVIAHRLSTIRQADRIVVMESGTVVEQGTYDELMSADGAFQKLVQRQVA